VLLADQDRTRWDAALIGEGTAILDDAVARRQPGSYQVEAAIAALHAAARSFEATDWPQIAALYGSLARLSPSPVVEVNRAVAAGLADGPQAGLAILEPVLASGALTGYAPLHAAHADLLERAGRTAEAAAAWERAERAMGNTPLQRELHRRRTVATGDE
jgi:RNA polymerase sigma-70 factor (ECF subfamily)